MKRAFALVLGVCALAGCRSPLAEGETLYRNGDPLAALATWRAIAPGHRDYARAQDRIGAARDEFEQLVTRYQQRARYYEERGQLGESILNYRLGLRLAPDDSNALAHVQELARELAAQKSARLAALRENIAKGELALARTRLATLREIDPLDPEIQRVGRELELALQAEVRERLERGRASLAAGDRVAAERAFREAVALDPESDDVRGYFAYLAALGGDAGGLAALPLPLSGDAADAVRMRAAGLFQNALRAEEAGRYFAALRQLLRARELDPSHVAAQERIEKLRARLTSEVPGLLRAGRDAFRSEDLETALEQWRRALLIEPQNERALAYIARAERQLANLERLRSEPLDVE
jgi:tetratricopeptide (TPR) repeat protein